MRTRWIRCSLWAFLALTISARGFALDWSQQLQTEEGFLASMGDRAISVAPGVYEVKQAGGDTVRVAFGDQGRQFDRERFESQLAVANTVLAKTAEPSRDLLRKIHRLEDLVAGLAPPTRARVTGWTCTGSLIQFQYTLDGARNGGTVLALAKIGKSTDFGPLPPSYPNRYADSYATAYRGKVCSETTVSASDSVTNGFLGFATATATVACVADCTAWETFSTVTQSGCSDGYRSLSRSGGTLANCL